MEDICRICLNIKDSFDTVTEYIDVIEKLVQFEFDRNPNLPQLICNECQQKLSVVKEMCTLCVKSNNFFLNCFLFDDPSHMKMENTSESEDTEYINFEILDEALDEPDIKLEKNDEKLLSEDTNIKQKIPIIKEEKIVRANLKTDLKKITFCKTPRKKEIIKTTLKVETPKYRKNPSLPRTYYYCCECPKFVFSSEQARFHYIKSHSSCEKNEIEINQKERNCKFCLKSFDTLKELKNHQSTKMSESTQLIYTCTICQESGLSLTDFKVHGETKHGSDAIYNCNLCSISYKNFNSFTSHAYVKHRNEQNNVCSECGKAYARKSYLKSHYRVEHQGQRDFQCMLCKITFKRNCNLKSHMRVHTGEKPYKCSDCSKAYSHYIDLKTHVAYRHTGVFKYNCTICGRGFVKPSQLKRHMNKHTIKMDLEEG